MSSPKRESDESQQIKSLHVDQQQFISAICRMYGESIPGNVLCERLASYKHVFNLYWSVRCVEAMCSIHRQHQQFVDTSIGHWQYKQALGHLQDRCDALRIAGKSPVILPASCNLR